MAAPRARIQEVAGAAGVSTSTVSNFLNRPERVSAGTAAKVQAAIDALDFLPHPGAAGLRHGRGSAIGVVVPDITNSFYASIVRGAGEAALAHGFALTLCHSGDDPERELAYFDLLSEQRAAGVVVVPLSADPERLARLSRRGIPLVLADRTRLSTVGCSAGVDDVTGGRLAAQHLLALGARDIAVVNGQLSIRQCADRLQGAMEAASAYPEARIRQVIVDEMTFGAGVAAARTLTEHRPDGVFATNDFLAAGVCQALELAGVGVPTEVSVVGYGDLDLATAGHVLLTTIAQPVDDLGREAVAMLLDEVESPDAHVHQAKVFTPRLVTRESAPAV